MFCGSKFHQVDWDADVALKRASLHKKLHTISKHKQGEQRSWKSLDQLRPFSVSFFEHSLFEERKKKYTSVN